MTIATEEGLAAALARIAAMPAFLRDALGRVPAGKRGMRPASGDFALVEQACHLRDLDREAFIVRARRMLSETLPELEPFHGDAVARERDYLAQDAAAAALDFERSRAELAALLASVAPARLSREGLFAGERITLGRLILMIDEHDREHRAQLEALTAFPGAA
jgi:hypothetical protein